MKKLFITLTFILFATYSIPILFNHSILLYYGDSIETMYPYFVHLTNQVKSGSFVLWNYSMGFGTNNFVNFFNGLGSPFVYIASIFPESYIPYLFVFFDIIRFYLIAYFSFLWSKKLFKHEDTRTIFSLLITFSGWVLHFAHFGFYLDGYMYLPLILYLSDEIIEKKKGLLFSLIISFTAFISPYFLYMHSIFLLIYQLFRYFSSNKLGIKLFVDFLEVFKFYILGVLLAAVVLLPEISIVLSSPRVGFNLITNIRLDLSISRLYNFITSFLSPVMNDYNPNLFFSRNNTLEKSIFYNYTSILSISALFGLIFTKFKEKKVYFSLLFIMIGSTFVPATNIIMNGNDNVRWMYMLSIVVIIGVGYFIDNYEDKKYNVLFPIFSALFLMFIFYTSISRNYIDSEFVRFSQFYFIALLILICFYGLCITLFKKNIILYVLCFEIIMIILFRMYIGLNPRYISSEDFVNINKVVHNDVFKDIEQNDSGFYRIDVKDAYGNDAIINDYMGFTFYSSLYNHSIRELLDERFTSNWNMGYVQSKFLLKHLYSSKYYVTDSFDKIAPFGFEKLKVIGEKSIYKQTYPTYFGFAYSNAISKDKLDNLDKSIQDYWFFNNAVTENTTLGKPELKVVPTILYSDFQNEYVDIANLGGGYIIIDYSRSNPYASCKIDYYKNKSLVKSDLLNEYGYAYLEINHDYDGFYLYCNSIHNYNEYIKSNIYYVDYSQVNELYLSLNNFDTFKDLVVESNRISSKIDISVEEAVVSTSIAYDKGWTVKANGKVIETLKVNYGFLGFKLPNGSYNIEFTYYPPLLKIGSYISISTLFLLLANKLIRRFKLIKLNRKK